MILKQKENYLKKFVDIINKKIRENQQIRNKIAHWKSKTNLNKELYFEKYDKQGDSEVLKPDKVLIRKFKKNKLFIIENVKIFYLKYKKIGTFERRSLINIDNDSWSLIYKKLKIFFIDNERLSI